MALPTNDRNLALYCDFENIALGVRDANYQKFNISHILERLLVKGSIVVKKAYCDWQRYKDFKPSMHEAAFELIDIPHLRQSGKNSADIRMVVDALDLCYTKAHVDTFVIISGDSDFSPLVSKLRENAKTVIGVGVKNSTSDLLIANCDEFIYYDDLVRELERKRHKPAKKRSKKRVSRPRTELESVEATSVSASAGGNDGVETDPVGSTAGDARVEGEPTKTGADQPVPADDSRSSRSVATRSRRRKSSAKTADSGSAGKVDSSDGSSAESDDELVEELADEAANDEGSSDDRAQEGIDLIVETATAMTAERGDSEKLWGSMIKQTLKRRRPGFNESYYGFDSFSKMLEEAESRACLELELDDRSGGYIIRRILT